MNISIEWAYIAILSVLVIVLFIRILIARDNHIAIKGHRPIRQILRYETKIKMFRGSDVRMLEKDINEWLKDNHQYVNEIIYQDNLTAMIIYRPIVEPRLPPQNE